MESKSQNEALRIIHNCALNYGQNLVHKNILFITMQNNRAVHFEAAFLPRNFLHLTGVQTRLTSREFYTMAFRDRMSEQDFRFASDGTTDKKLDILPTLMKIHLTARMVGDYDYSKSLLVTDKIAGTVAAAMGFRKNGDSDFYVPNTALNTDLRVLAQNPVQRIAAMFIKKKQDQRYRELTYIAKGLTIDEPAFSSIIQEKVDLKELKASFPIPQMPMKERLDI